MAIIVNINPTEAMKLFRAMVRVVSKTHFDVIPNHARQILVNEAETLGIIPADVKKVFGMYNFSESESEERWVSVTEEQFPRWKFLAKQPELGTCWREPRTGMEFVWVPGGEFEMGNLFGEGFGSEKPVHEVELDGFWLGRCPVTQEEWRKVIGQNPPYVKKGSRYPVEKISWEDAQTFIQKLNGAEENRFRLPTEAEWEYAARSGGKREKYAGGEHVDHVAWYNGNSEGTTHPVRRKAPNGLGLFDMSGNVWEWCQDWFDDEYYEKSPHTNPRGPSKGSYRVLRSGSWDSSPTYIRSSGRNYWDPSNGDFNTGFRLVRTYL